MTAIEDGKVVRGIRPDHIEAASKLFDQKVGTEGREVVIRTNASEEVQIVYSDVGLKEKDKRPL